MKNVVFMCIALLVPLSSAQPDWEWSHPCPTGMGISGISFATADRGWIVSEYGEVFETTDGGSTWTLLLKEPGCLYGVQFIDTVRGWICGEKNSDGYTAFTVNGGGAWQTSQLGEYSLEAVEFIDQNYGTMVSTAGGIYRSQDGGNSWNYQGSGTTSSLYDVSFVSPTHGWVCGKEGACLRTTTAGAFWDALTPPNHTYRGVHFLDEQNGFIAGDDRIYSTGDGGASWTQTFAQSGESFRAMDISGGLGAVTGRYGAAVSENAGTSWSWESLPLVNGWSETYNYFNAVCVNGDRIWAAGDLGYMCTRTSLGDWEQLSSHETLGSLKEITYYDDDHVWACGEDGILMRSTDGGVSWESQVWEDEVNFQDICFPTVTTGYACGYYYPSYAPVILKTTDGGVNWLDVTPSGTPATSFNSIDFMDADHGVAVSGQGYIEHTSDGGATWETETQFSSKSFGRVRFGDTDRGWAVGSSGTIVCFDLLSDSWSLQNAPIGYTYHGLYPVNRDTVFAVGWNGTVSRTFDTGNTWVNVAMTGDDYGDVWFDENAQTGYLANLNGRLSYTFDGGTNIYETPAGGLDDACCYHLAIATADYGWCCGYSGMILRFGTATSVEDREEEAIDPSATPVLRFSGNPFSSATTVSVQMPLSAQARLDLYDLTGRVVENLHAGELTGGEHSFCIDGNGLPPGVYFLLLEGGGLRATSSLVRVP